MSTNTVNRPFFVLLSFSLFLAFCVIALGAYTRLSDAGLGCPDWPGCYGEMLVPEHNAVDAEQYQRPLETDKAWKEMIHRYAAASLGMFILLIALGSLMFRRQLQQKLLLPFALLATVIFQALLGRWTVTELLSPLIVTGHLLGGFTTLALLWWLWLNQYNRSQTQQKSEYFNYKISRLRFFSTLALLLLIGQIFLGGWTSTHYSALACGSSFPSCQQGLWWPTMDFEHAFSLSWQSGVNYEYGILDSPTRTAIHWTHRIGALIVFLYLGLLSLKLMLSEARLKGIAQSIGVLLVLQVGLGITNVVASLPLGVAVMHNVTAALLLLAVITLNYRVYRAHAFNREKAS